MTNLEAIRANISDAHGVVLTENHFVKALADQGLYASGTYNGNSKIIDKATLVLYNIVIESASFSEGSLSYNINIQGVKQAKAALENRMGIHDSKRKVKSPKVW